MPVDMTAMTEDCTSSVHKLRGVRNEPPSKPPKLPRRMPLAMSKTHQIKINAAIMPMMRASISVARINRVTGPSCCRAGLWLVLGALDMGVSEDSGFYLDKNRATFASGAAHHSSDSKN